MPLHRLYSADTLAPPAVGAVSYLAVGGGAGDLLGRALIKYALLQALLVLRMMRWIGEAPFSAAYWAFTFGGVALATAVAKIAVVTHGGAMGDLAPKLFFAANLLVAVVTLGTVRLLFTGRLLPSVSPLLPTTKHPEA